MHVRLQHGELSRAAQGHLAPILIRVLGLARFAKLVVSQGAKDMDKERGDRLVGLIASQDRTLMLSAWKEMMAFDSRCRLADVRCPTLVVAGSRDYGVPMHHATMLHDGIAGRGSSSSMVRTTRSCGRIPTSSSGSLRSSSKQYDPTGPTIHSRAT